MRVKIVFQDPTSQKKGNFLLSVPKHLKSIVDLQVHIIDKLGLGDYIEKHSGSVFLSIDGYNLPKKEKISELVKEDDTITVEFTGPKRKNEYFLDATALEHNEGDNSEAYQDHQFMRLIQEVSHLRTLYSKSKKLKMEESGIDEGNEDVFEEIKESKKGTGILKKGPESNVVKRNEEITSKAPKNKINKNIDTKKKSIVESDSESESEEEVETPKAAVKQKKQPESKPIITQKAKEETNKKAKPEQNISKPIKKVVKEEEESSESEEEPVIKEKKITTILHIPTPTDEFLKKKEEWDKLPVSQWGAKQKEKKENKGNKTTKTNEDQEIETKNEKKPQKSQEPKTQPSSNIGKPVSFVPAGQTANQQKVNNEKEKTVQKQTKPQQSQSQTETVKGIQANKGPAQQPYSAQTKPITQSQYDSSLKGNQTYKAPVQQQSYQSYQSSQNLAKSAPQQSNSWQNKKGMEPAFKIPIYEPNLLNSVTEDNQKAQIPSNINAEYLEVPISGLSEKWRLENVMLLHVNDVLKYKCETFSAKLMAPVISDWRNGTITNIEKSKIFIKRSDILPTQNKEVEEGEQEDEETEEDELYLHNFKAIWVLRSCLDQDRKKTIETLLEFERQKTTTDDLALRKKKLQEELQKKLQESEENAMVNENDYKKRMIGKQVNYYFSDKNYMKDQFIKAHTEKDPEKYMPISLLLNFPKIRSMTQDVNLVLEGVHYVLEKDGKNCAYEIDPTNTKIRKRGL